jgi:hypothetical protein
MFEEINIKLQNQVSQFSTSTAQSTPQNGAQSFTFASTKLDELNYSKNVCSDSQRIQDFFDFGNFNISIAPTTNHTHLNTHIQLEQVLKPNPIDTPK